MAGTRALFDQAVSSRRQLFRGDAARSVEPSFAPLRWRQLVFGLAVFGACTGTVPQSGNDGAGGDGTDSSNPGSEPTAPGSSLQCTRPLLASGMRRLSRPEYMRTIRDLFPGVDVGQPSLTPDQNTLVFENRAKNLYATDTNVADFNAAAAAAAAV